MNYEDIIYLEHYTSKVHQRMPLQDRAAQFSPFAALTGFDAVIDETRIKHQSLNDTHNHDIDDSFSF